jgi:pectin methylesterase-like acyl-CoA thioesterase
MKKSFFMIRTITCAFILIIFAASESVFAITKKQFDFVVGVNGNFKAALTAASAAASTGKRFYIFFPNGEYAIGSLTGDANQMTTITTSNISYIGESTDKTIIYNKAINEGISITATLHFNKANNIYMQDLTVLNKGNYGSTSIAGTARYVALEDRGDKNIYKNVKLLSNQDTYYTLGNRTYWEDGQIHGFVDFICGQGDIFFNKCLLYLENRSSVIIAAPSTSTSWGYVFMNCTIDGAAGDGYRLARSWNNQPRCVFINTTMKKVPASAGWGDPMNVVPKLFAEYNSKTASGAAVNLSGRRTTYTLDGTTATINPVLSATQAAQYTIKNVLSGSDNWQPDSYTKQAIAPVVTFSGTALKWGDNDDVLCWVVFKDGKFFKCVTVPQCEITSSDTKSLFFVRAANEMGGLGDSSNVIDASKLVSVLNSQNGLSITSGITDQKLITMYNPTTKSIRLQGAYLNNLKVNVFSLNGRQVLSREFTAGNTTGSAEVSLVDLKHGMYFLKTECDGIVKSGYFNYR